MNSHSGLPYIYTIYMKVLFDVLFAMLLLRAYAVSGKLTTLGKVRYRKLTQQTLSRIERQNKLVTFFLLLLLFTSWNAHTIFQNPLLLFTVFRNKYGQTVTVGICHVCKIVTKCVFVCTCVCVCACLRVCVCVSVRERETERVASKNDSTPYS